MATGMIGKIGSALGMQSGAGPLTVRFNALSAEGLRSLDNRALDRIYFAVSVAGTGGSRAKTNDIPFNVAAGSGSLSIPAQAGLMTLHCAPENSILLQCYRDVRLLPDTLLGEATFPLQTLLSSQQPQWINLAHNGQMTGRVLLQAALEGPTPGLMGQGANMPGQTTYTGQTAGAPQMLGGTGATGMGTGTGMMAGGAAGGLMGAGMASSMGHGSSLPAGQSGFQQQQGSYMAGSSASGMQGSSLPMQGGNIAPVTGLGTTVPGNYGGSVPAGIAPGGAPIPSGSTGMFGGRSTSLAQDKVTMQQTGLASGNVQPGAAGVNTGVPGSNLPGGTQRQF